MRIIGGRLKGRTFEPPAGVGIRPTTDRAREALFNLLQQYTDFQDIIVLDLFAGSGAVAFEAVSRGAQHATCIERNPITVRYLSKQVQIFKLNNDVQIICQTVEDFLAKPLKTDFDLIFLDPPYVYPNKSGLIAQIYSQSIVKVGGIVVLEHPSGEVLSQLSRFQTTRNYGESAFSIFV